MNATELIQSYFDPDAVARLAQLVGLEPETTGRVLEAGVLLQLQALAQSAENPGGEVMIAEAVGALPAFGSVAGALEESGGADHLQQAGEMLAPALLGETANSLPAQVAAQTGADPASVQTLLQMTLPLLLSVLGQRGLQAGDIAPMLASPGESDLGEPEPEGAAAGTTAESRTIVVSVDEATVSGAVAAAPQAVTPEAPEGEPDEVMGDGATPIESLPAGAIPVPLETSPSASVPPAPTLQESIPPKVAPLDPNSPEGLLKALQLRFGGAVGQQIGAVAGFGGGVRKQAALAALPVVLAALAGKARAGGNLEALARPFASLTDEDGQVNTALLDSPVEVARIEGQGRGLLASLFGDVNAVTGRLGSALGGSGDSSRRLLALLTPLVLSALTRAHSGGLAAVPWGGLTDGLKGALPSGFSSLGVLIGSLAAGTPLPGTAPAPAPAPRTVPTGAPTRPSPLKPPRPARFETPAPPPPPPARRRGGFPLWLIPLLVLLLLGGCWLVQNRQSMGPVTPTPVPDTTSGTAPASGAGTPGTTDGGAMPAMPVQPVFTAPQSGAAVPSGGFTLRGTGPVGEVLEVFLEDTRVGGATVGPDGAWSLDVGDGAPTGPQTYTLRNAAGGEMAALNVVVGAPDADSDGADTLPAGTGGSDTAVPGATAAEDTASAASGDSGGAAAITVGSPASGAQVSSAGFTLSGTGTAGQTFEVLEDGVSVGSFTVGASGTWTRAVPAPGEGEKTYVIRSAEGDEVASAPVTVEAPSVSAQGAACTQPLSVSLKDGETVTAPYRFGGRGSGSAYTVIVQRGGRTVGRRTVQLGAGCGWSFTSNPGVRTGKVGSVTYEVRPAEASASDAPGARLTLNVR